MFGGGWGVGGEAWLVREGSEGKAEPSQGRGWPALACAGSQRPPLPCNPLKMGVQQHAAGCGPGARAPPVMMEVMDTLERMNSSPACAMACTSSTVLRRRALQHRGTHLGECPQSQQWLQSRRRRCQRRQRLGIYGPLLRCVASSRGSLVAQAAQAHLLPSLLSSEALLCICDCTNSCRNTTSCSRNEGSPLERSHSRAAASGATCGAGAA